MITGLLDCRPFVADSSRAEFLLKEDVVVVFAQDDSARLLDMAGEFHAISAVGAAMLREALNQDLERAARTLAEQYRTPEDVIRQDLLEFVTELENVGLLRRRGNTNRRPKWQQWTTGILGAALWLLQARFGSPVRRATRLMTLARISCRLFGWSRTVAAWQRAFSMRKSPTSYSAQEIDEFVRAAAACHILTVECKERGLACWALLRQAGVAAECVVGINLFPLEGHCWCEAGSIILSDYPDRCQTFFPVLRYS